MDVTLRHHYYQDEYACGSIYEQCPETGGIDMRGARHQLLVDRRVGRDCKTRRPKLYTAGIDYKKAYD